MIKVINDKLGNERDLVIFEVHIPAEYFANGGSTCTLINFKLRVNKNNKPYLVAPCQVEEKEDGTKSYHSLTLYDGVLGYAFKNELIPQLKAKYPDIFSKFS